MNPKDRGVELSLLSMGLNYGGDLNLSRTNFINKKPRTQRDEIKSEELPMPQKKKSSLIYQEREKEK